MVVPVVVVVVAAAAVVVVYVVLLLLLLVVGISSALQAGIEPWSNPFRKRKTNNHRLLPSSMQSREQSC